MRLRALLWVGAGALVVLAARAISYALAPSPLAVELASQTGGPTLPVVAAVSVGLAIAISVAVVWIAASAVAERRLLEPRAVADTPLRLRRLLARAVALWLATMLAFAVVESYLHWRQGLGWHGLHCLTGPVHRNAIPILGALSLLAAALACAVEQLIAWARRTLAAIAPGTYVLTVTAPHRAAADLFWPPAPPGAFRARSPPRLS
jgi:hypothetical protein